MCHGRKIGVVLLFLLLALIISAVVFCFIPVTFIKALLVLIGSFLAVNVLYLLFWAIAVLFIDTSKPIEKESRLFHRGCVGISSLALGYCGVRTKVFGPEKLPADGRFLLVCNHRSLFDPLILVKYLKNSELAFIGKPEALNIPVIGKVGYGAGCLPIDRGNDREALKTILTAVSYLKKGLCSMAIFPEGTRNKTEDVLLPFRAGSFKIAQKAGVPLVVAALKGTGSISGNMFRRITDTELYILDVIPAEKVKETKTREMAEYCKKAIAERLVK